MAPITSPLRITNLEDGETIHQRCLLVTGTYELPAAEGSYIHVATKAANKSETFPEQTWPLAGGNFKALVMLSPGLNILEFAYVCNDCLEHTIEVNVNHWPLLQYPPLHLAIMVASDSPCVIDCPPNKAAGVSSAHSDLDAAIAKLRMTAYMWQAMTAEDLRLHGVGRRSFRLDEEWVADTTSRDFLNARMDQCLEREGAMRSTAKVNVIRSSKTVEQIRNANIAQQNPRAYRKNDLFDFFQEALKEAGGPFASNARPIVAGLILDSHYNVSKKLILGHAALGCHNPEGLSLGMFGSHLTYSWPRFMEEVTSCLTDTRAPGDKVGNDNGECATIWEACAIGQGAHIHEVGHAFGSPHRPGIMERGYAQDWPKNFLSKTAYSAHLKEKGVLVDLAKTPNEARWNLADALAFRMLPHFRLPTDAVLTEEERNEKPKAFASNEDEEGPATLNISSASGIVRITFNRTEHSQPLGWRNNAPKTMEYTEADLEQRFDRTTPLHLQILAFNGKETSIRDAWKLLSSRSFVRIPGSTLRLTKHLAVPRSVVINQEDDAYEWAQLLREKGADGKLHRAVSIDFRVGCLWDGGVVKYADGHISHWGPMQRYGRKHGFGGHASKKIRLPEGVEISSIEVNPQSGVRMHLADGTSAGELNTRGDTENVITTLAPSPDEVIVGFFGKSSRSGFCGVLEFGIITAPKDVGLDGLPEQVWEMNDISSNNADEKLMFENNEAAEAAMQERETKWSGVKDDDTIPKNDEERRYWVTRLLLAMKNRINVMDRNPKKRWHPERGFHYPADQMESVCWRAVDAAEHLHKCGLNSFPIYDQVVIGKILCEQNLTFVQRMRALIKLLYFFKSRCDAFMKGVGNEDTIANPQYKLKQSVENRLLNDARAIEKATNREMRGIVTKKGRTNKTPAMVVEEGHEDVEVGDGDTETDSNAQNSGAHLIASRKRSPTPDNCMSLSSHAEDVDVHQSLRSYATKSPENAIQTTSDRDNIVANDNASENSLNESMMLSEDDWDPYAIDDVDNTHATAPHPALNNTTSVDNKRNVSPGAPDLVAKRPCNCTKQK
ncbi:Metallopep domain-containing protein [Pyrenophora tritici-repentis]|nr:Metallopep domain-containing protein [Pyrenophora tritici-repentis]